MIRLWMAVMDRTLTDRERAALLSVLPAERRARLTGQLLRQQAETLCAYGLLLALLREQYGWTEFPPMEYGDGGKPFFPAYPQVHFSLSHTEGAVAGGISDAPVGVDIQRIQMPPKRLARLLDAETPDAFSNGWAQWEARAKRTGSGILDMIRRRPPLAAGEVCTEVIAFPGCCCAAAGAETVRPEQVRRMTLDGLLCCLDI